MTILEQCARAVCRHNVGNEDNWEAWIGEVRAVLEALEKLNQSMIAAGAKLSAMKPYETLQRLNAMAIFRAMLTQALKDHP